MSEQLTANQKLQTWLDSDEKNYQAGLALFMEYSRNRSMQHYLMRKQDIAKLVYEIGKLNDHKNLKSAGEVKQVLLTKEQTPEEITQRVKIADGKISFDDLPEILQGYYIQNTNEYKTMRSLHEKMKQAKTDDERAGIRKGLVNLDDKIAGRWKAIDHWVATKELPQGKGVKNFVNTDITPQQVTKYRAAVSRSLASLENADTTEKKQESSLQTLTESAKALIDGKQVFEEKTTERIRVFIPDFNKIEDPDNRK